MSLSSVVGCLVYFILVGIGNPGYIEVGVYTYTRFLLGI